MTESETGAPAPAERRPALVDSSKPTRRSIRAAIVLAAVLLPQVVLYWPSLAGGKVALPLDLLYELFPETKTVPANLNHALWDPISQYEPSRRFVASELHAGRVPLWNPKVFCGAPLFTNTWSPFQWPYYLWPDPSVLGWTALLKALVAGGGAFLFFRRVARVAYWPAVAGAAIYPLTMFFVQWQYYVISSACTWLPWLLWLTDATVRRPRGLAPIGAAAATAAVFVEGLGAPWPHMLLASGLYALWCWFDEYGCRRLWSRAAVHGLAAICCAWALGAGVSAIQNLPAADYLRTSHRIAARTAGSVEQPPSGQRAWLEWVLPHHSGDMTSNSFYLPRQGNQLESAATASAGLLAALVLAPLAFCNPQRRSCNYFWVGLGLFGMAFQADIPVLSEIFRVFPFNVLRNNRFTFYTGWATVALAVNGLEALIRGQSPPVATGGSSRQAAIGPGVHIRSPFRWRRGLWIAVALVAGAALETSLRLSEIPADFLHRGMPVQAAWFQRIYLCELAVCVVALASWRLIASRSIKRASVAAAIAGLAISESLFNAWNVNPQCDRRHYYPPTALTEAVREATPGRVAMARYLRPNVGMMYGFSEVRGYDGADPHRVVSLYRAIDPEWPMVSPHAITLTFDPPHSPIMDMLNLRYVYHAGHPPARATVLARDGAGWIEVRPNALPRAFVPKRVETVASDAACLERLKQREFNPRAVAFVQGKVDLAPAFEASGAAEIVADASTRVVVSADMQTAGLLVLADGWDEGWIAFVNGRPAPIVRTNFLVRGVELSAGEHTVEFRFQPQSFTWGLRGTAVCGTLLAVWSAMAWRRRRRRL